MQTFFGAHEEPHIHTTDVRNLILEQVIHGQPAEIIRSTAAAFIEHRHYTDEENVCLRIHSSVLNHEFHLMQDYIRNYFVPSKKERAPDLGGFLEKGFAKFIKSIKQNENSEYLLVVKLWSLVSSAESDVVASSVVDRHTRLTFLSYDELTGNALFYSADPYPDCAIKMSFTKIGERSKPEDPLGEQKLRRA